MPAPLDLVYPFAGRWLVQNSPANRVPSHGTTLFASSYAIDFVPVTEHGQSAPLAVGSFFRPEPADRFSGFGRTVVAPVGGVILAAHDGEPDHPAYRGIPSLVYAATQRKRVSAGWRAIAGNHVMIGTGAAVVALCHLRRGSVRVRPSQAVRVGEVIGRCGNSGNSTEPHLHLQVSDDIDIGRAGPVPITFHGSVPGNGEIVIA